MENRAQNKGFKDYQNAFLGSAGRNRGRTRIGSKYERSNQMQRTARPDGDDQFEELKRRIADAIAAKQLRLDSPYVKDLIEVLMPYRQGLWRQEALRRLEKKRRDAGVPIPRKFEEAVQSAYNQHSVDSLVFKKRGAPEAEGLFYSPAGKGSGKWAVHLDRAVAWLEANLADRLG